MLFRAAMLSRQSFGTNHVAVHRPPLICSRPKICLRNRSHLAFSNFKIKDFGGMEPLTLESEAKTVLEDYLSDHTFCSQVYDNAKAKSLGTTVKYTGLLFEPVPWSPSTPHGMPQIMEEFYKSDRHVVINVPPLFMFKAKIFKPTRLCAVFELV